MTTFLQTLETFFWNVLNRPGLSDIADILIVAIIIYELLMLTRDTRGSAVLKGLAMLLLIVGISNLFGLTALNWLLMSVVNNGALVLVILFQPELRKALEQIGRGARIETKRRDTDKDEATRIIDEIIRCLQDLSRRHVGALIVFEQKTGLQDIIERKPQYLVGITFPPVANRHPPLAKALEAYADQSRAQLAKAVEEDMAAKLGAGDAMALKLLLKRLIASSDPGMPDLWSAR